MHETRAEVFYRRDIGRWDQQIEPSSDVGKARAQAQQRTDCGGHYNGDDGADAACPKRAGGGGAHQPIAKHRKSCDEAHPPAGLPPDEGGPSARRKIGWSSELHEFEVGEVARADRIAELVVDGPEEAC